MRARIFAFVAIVQSILFLAHLALYETWMFFLGPLNSSRTAELRVTLAILSVSFVAATLLAHQSSHFVVRIFYSISSVWLGLVNFFLLAMCACWVVYGVPGLLGLQLDRRPLAIAFFGASCLTGVYGVVNAAWTRVKKIMIGVPNLPASWQGRTAAMVSDLHLGHVRNRRFLRRIVTTIARLRPDIVFIPGDLFDGTAVDMNRLDQPLSKLSAPLGVYFVNGNHEEFSSPGKYNDAVRRCGIRVLVNEKVNIDGVQIVGVDYLDSTNVEHFRSVLRKIGVDRDAPSVLLVHTPDRLQTAAEEGISLQLSGHTHRGQFFPFNLIVARIYREFAYGLHHFGALAVYTSCGAGTWGPPMRVGTNPEIVLIRFELLAG